MQKSASLSPPASRLLGRLREIDISATPVAPGHVSERIGSLLDLTDSVTLSKMLGGLDKLGDHAAQMTIDVAKEAFIEEYNKLAGSIVKRLGPNQAGASRDRLPTPVEFHANCISRDVFSIKVAQGAPNCNAAFTPYRKKYLAIQGKLDLACHRLRANTARAIAGLSPAMAKISALDMVLGDAFYHQQRQLFAKVPRLLEEHFTRLLDTHWKALPHGPKADDLAHWLAPDGWVALFCIKMRDLLLAELETRLQPVIGIIESAYGIETNA